VNETTRTDDEDQLIIPRGLRNVLPKTCTTVQIGVRCLKRGHKTTCIRATIIRILLAENRIVKQKADNKIARTYN